MKIGFDASDLSAGRRDGTTRYTAELLKRLPKLASQDEWLAYGPSEFQLDIKSVNLQQRITPWPKYWTQLRLPWALYADRPDVLFMPIQQLPVLRPKRMKTVAVIHDLAVHKFPEQFTYKDWALLHIFSAQAAREADAIIAVSQATADDIAYYYGRTENVQVVHHGVDHGRFQPKNLQVAFAEIKRPYILYVGQIQPRKNLVRLVKAFAALSQSRPELQLVIAGGHGWLKGPIMEGINKSPVRDKIVLTGTVSDELLPALYQNAEAFVLPSLYEGFGMPILEALACGCPVVTSNVSSMPEVAGGAAVLIDPKDIDSMKSGIEEALQRREELIEKGMKRAAEFSWDKTARQTLEVIKALRE